MQTRSGTKLIYTLQEGETWTIYKGKLIVVHPERKPKIVQEDGTVEEIDTDLIKPFYIRVNPYDC